MTDVFTTGRWTFVGRPANKEMRTSVNTRADVQSAFEARLPARPDDEPGNMDDVAGCEFVDDRIRLTE